MKIGVADMFGFPLCFDSLIDEVIITDINNV